MFVTTYLRDNQIRNFSWLLVNSIATYVYFPLLPKSDPWGYPSRRCVVSIEYCHATQRIDERRRTKKPRWGLDGCGGRWANGKIDGIRYNYSVKIINACRHTASTSWTYIRSPRCSNLTVRSAIAPNPTIIATNRLGRYRGHQWSAIGSNSPATIGMH